MSKVEKIESSIQELHMAPSELREIRDWLDDMLEDDLEFTSEFEAKIQTSESDMREGRAARVVRQ